MRVSHGLCHPQLRLFDRTWRVFGLFAYAAVRLHGCGIQKEK